MFEIIKSEYRGREEFFAEKQIIIYRLDWELWGRKYKLFLNDDLDMVLAPCNKGG